MIIHPFSIKNQDSPPLSLSFLYALFFFSFFIYAHTHLHTHMYIYFHICIHIKNKLVSFSIVHNTSYNRQHSLVFTGHIKPPSFFDTWYHLIVRLYTQTFGALCKVTEISFVTVLHTCPPFSTWTEFHSVSRLKMRRSNKKSPIKWLDDPYSQAYRIWRLKKKK